MTATAAVVPTEADLIEIENYLLKPFLIAASDGTASDRDHRLLMTLTLLIDIARNLDPDPPPESDDGMGPSDLLKARFA